MFHLFTRNCMADTLFRCLTLCSPSLSCVFRPTVKLLPKMLWSRPVTIWSRTWVFSPVNSPRSMSCARWWDLLLSSRTASTDSRWIDCVSRYDPLYSWMLPPLRMKMTLWHIPVFICMPMLHCDWFCGSLAGPSHFISLTRFTVNVRIFQNRKCQTQDQIVNIMACVLIHWISIKVVVMAHVAPD